MPVRLLIVDDEDLFREGLARLLARDGDFRVVGQVRTGSEAIERATKSPPDLMLTAIALSDVNGIDLTRTLRKQHAGLRAAIVARTFTRAALVEGARAGVTGFITKDTTVDALTAALKAVARGEAYVPADVSVVLLEALAGAGSRDADEEGIAIDRAKITEREKDVLQLLVEGATNRDIARLLSITENTVKVHLRNILDKLHLRNRQQAAAFAISSGLVTLPRSSEQAHRRGRDVRHRPQRPNAALGGLRQ